MSLQLIIGNKNYSSWSLRPWLALRAANAVFDEIRIPLFRADTKARILEHSPGGKVPVLRDGALVIWESLAICEYVAERFREAVLWPKDARDRALARAISSEMHAGFVNLRKELPMDARARKTRTPSDQARAEIDRVLEIWRTCRQASGGPYLFGRFGIADAMYAPVVLRFRSYAIDVDTEGKEYMDTMLALPALRAWCADAEIETEVVAHG